jgi:hypothetical protein
MNNSLSKLNLARVFTATLCSFSFFACNQDRPITVAGPDLQLKVSVSSTVVQVGGNFSSVIDVKNIGLKDATVVVLSIPIPLRSSYVSSSNGCQLVNAVLGCSLGTLSANGSAQVTVNLTAVSAGSMVQTASVSAAETDPVTGNNSSSANVTVQDPSVGTIKLPPVGKVSWDWQIGASGDSNVVVPTGATLIDVDGFNITAAGVASLKAKGAYTVCYLDVGSWEPGRADSGDYPAYLKIQQDPDWPAEYFLDINDVWKANSVLATILQKRFKMCADKGFDAIEPDNLQNDENVKGGKITLQNQIDFNGWVADNAHVYNLAVFQKNGPDKILLKDKTGKMMVEKFDGILNEQCQEFSGECGMLTEYVKRGKLALDAEYNVTVNCTTSNSLNINSIRKDLSLTGGNMSGYKRIICP